jgi:prevent-host-death family protein
MQTIGISHFKARDLRLIDDVDKHQEVIVVTKRGKPVARIVLYGELAADLKTEKSEYSKATKGDLASPLGEIMWDGG